MLRLFVPSAQATGSRVRIAGRELRHLRTLRLGPGDRLLIFDEQGIEHEARLERLGTRLAEATVLASDRPRRESVLDLVLAMGALKGLRMDFVVEKATELGVRRIAPVRCRHDVARGSRVERWRRIALSAAKQSGRTNVPDVDEPRSLAEFVRDARPGLRLLAWERERERRLAGLQAAAAAVTVLVGPEGGFAEEEVEDARAHGFITVSLAPRVLRAETAAITAVALCQHRWGDVG